MSDPKHEDQTNDLPDPHVQEKRGFAMVWLIPLVAALLGGGLVVRTLAEKGPTVRIAFDSGEGLEAGKTKIKYKALEMGMVTDVELTDDLQGVVATATLDREAAPYLNEETVFWIVRPRIGASGISGLDALVSGSYIGILPGEGDTAQRDFEALDHHPLRANHPDALRLVLHAEKRGSVRRGTAITYRNLEAGEIADVELDVDGQGVTMTALIDPQYAKLITRQTQFWNASGIDVSVGANGLQVHTESLAALLGGGIAFDTPTASEAPRATNGDRYALHASADDAARAEERYEGLDIVLESHDAGSISEGAPVYYRQQQIGHVGEHALSPDAMTVRFRVHIEREYVPLVRRGSRFWNASGVQMHVGLDGLDLQTGTLASILAGGVVMATPDDPGPVAEPGQLFALHDRPEHEWLAWSPTIWLAGTEEQVAHVIPTKHRQARGLALVLEATHVGAMKPGGGIYYRQVKVGEIGEHELSADSRSVKVNVLIEPRYAKLVRSNSRFWNASGIHAHFGLSGLDIDTESLSSILAGGIAFATPDEPGRPVEPGTLFPLHVKAEDEWHAWSPEIRLASADAGKTVHHAIHVDNHRSLFGSRTVSSEAIDPNADPDKAVPAVATGPNGAAPQRSFFGRLFAR